MREVILTVVLVLLSALTLPGSALAEEKELKSAAPAATGQQNAASAGENKQPIKLSAEEAAKVVAARVNGVDIMLDSVIRMAAQLNAQVEATHNPHGTQEAPSIEKLQEEALNRLILQELAYQRSKTAGIVVEQSAIDESLKTIKERAGGEDPFKQLLANERMTEDALRGQIAKNIAIERIYAREVLDKPISIPEDKMEAEYEKNKSKFVQQEKISIVDVVLFMDAADKESAAKAENILKKIKENNDDPTKLVQDGTFVVRDYEPHKDTDKELIEAAEKLKPGDISGIIKTSDGMHIIKLKDYQPEKQYSYDEVKPLIERKLIADEQSLKAKEWFEGLKKDAKIELLLHPADKQIGRQAK
jgi:parvulin-like peptidyl-prolyl isomerase